MRDLITGFGGSRRARILIGFGGLVTVASATHGLPGIAHVLVGFGIGYALS